MFLGISHLILTTKSNEISSKIDILEKIGYEVDFIENNLQNDRKKIKFMFNENIYHNIIFLKHKNRYAIELIEYNSVESMKSNILISFGIKLDIRDKIIDRVLEYNIFYNETLNIEYFISSENRFIFKTKSIREEIFFWNQIGFKNINSLVHIKSPLPQWRAKIEFIVDSDCKYNYMDNIGVNTLCLLTNSIDKDRIGNSSKLFKMNINKKETRNLLIKRDSYNIELLEIK